ncbi:MAG: hypothetical protein H6651_06960 [Ardenticatenales bacterium]|nr:hypothetical protein [Ardenticatenales bacterium]
MIAHSCLGALTGYLGWRKGTQGMLIAWIAGGLALVAIYFVGGALFYDLGFRVAAAEIPINLFQVGLGVLGLGLYQLVKRAYPQIDQLGGKASFQER